MGKGQGEMSFLFDMGQDAAIGFLVIYSIAGFVAYFSWNND